MRASALFFGVLLYAVSAAGANLPADVSTRVGRAQSFIYNWTADQYANELTTRDYIWHNAPASLQNYTLRLPAGVFSSAYTAVGRVGNYPEAYGASVTLPGWKLEWFQANHPGWIVLRGDRQTPAYSFNDPTMIPLDYTNPEVQNWRATNEVGPILSAGYQGISVDNVTDRNDFDWEGVCAVSTVATPCPAGAWTQKWSGAVSGDAQFLADEIAWLKAVAAFVHARNAALSANITYNPADPAGTAALIAAADLWYDEAGFTGDSEPSACAPAGGGSGVVGQAWIDKFRFVANLNNGAGVPNVQENSICPVGTPTAQGRAVLDYALASYLLTKNAHTYFLGYFDDPAAHSDASAWLELSWEHGPATGFALVNGNGVFSRAFANGLVLLNPSTTASATYDLGGVVYRDFAGNSVSGVVTLPSASAKVLVASAPSVPCQVSTDAAVITLNCPQGVAISVQPR